MFFLKNINFVYSHVYREGNTCADDLTNLGLNYSLNDFVWFDSIPDSIRGNTIKIGWGYLIIDLLPVKKFWPSSLFSLLYFFSFVY